MGTIRAVSRRHRSDPRLLSKHRVGSCVVHSPQPLRARYPWGSGGRHGTGVRSTLLVSAGAAPSSCNGAVQVGDQYRCRVRGPDRPHQGQARCARAWPAGHPMPTSASAPASPPPASQGARRRRPIRHFCRHSRFEGRRCDRRVQRHRNRQRRRTDRRARRRPPRPTGQPDGAARHKPPHARRHTRHTAQSGPLAVTANRQGQRLRFSSDSR